VLIMASLLAGALGLAIGSSVKPKADRAGFFDYCGADYLFGMRLLPMGRA
jgi:hypothetical protein